MSLTARGSRGKSIQVFFLYLEFIFWVKEKKNLNYAKKDGMIYTNSLSIYRFSRARNNSSRSA